MPRLVMKFGGTSVANLDRIRNAAERVRLEVAKGYDVIVIVSAMSGKPMSWWGGSMTPRRSTTQENMMLWSHLVRM